MYGLTVNRTIILSGHPLIINKISITSVVANKVHPKVPPFYKMEEDKRMPTIAKIGLYA